MQAVLPAVGLAHNQDQTLVVPHQDRVRLEFPALNAKSWAR